MSDFDELKKDTEREAQEHTQQVHEGEQDAEKEGKELVDKKAGGQQQGQDQDAQQQ